MCLFLPNADEAHERSSKLGPLCSGFRPALVSVCWWHRALECAHCAQVHSVAAKTSDEALEINADDGVAWGGEADCDSVVVEMYCEPTHLEPEPHSTCSRTLYVASSRGARRLSPASTCLCSWLFTRMVR
mmetsp:Transcript_12239/g.28578  ORF Transcript_12239/g.28578 Transcript_12239/m.28578 type:complete len:130 (+) Transcript_12239:1588-1977(+)